MAAMAPDGAGEVINLTGLTLQAEMDLALRTGQYRSGHMQMARIVTVSCSGCCYHYDCDQLVFLLSVWHNHDACCSRNDIGCT